jgi:activator of HSP90 ATPase
MAKTIIQEVVFQNTGPRTLYDLYMNADMHSLIAGGAVTIDDKEGSAFSAHGGYITGKNLQLIKDKLIVQSWRTLGWDAAATDSTFILYMEQRGNDTVLTMTHANIPNEHVDSIEKGWFGHYWNPWKQHLAGEEIIRPQM